MKSTVTKLVALLAALLLLTACAPVESTETTTEPTTQATTQATTAPTTEATTASTQPSETTPAIMETNGWVYLPAETPEAVAQSAVEKLADQEGISSVKFQFAAPFPQMADLYITKLLNGTYENKKDYTKEYLQSHLQVVTVPYEVTCEDASRSGNYQCNFAMLLDDESGLWNIWGDLTPASDAVPRTGWHCEPAETPEAAAQGTIESLKNAYSVLDVKVLSVEYDSELTEINRKLLTGGELVKAMGLTDAQLETHFKIINVIYEQTIDTEIPDRRMDSGKFEYQFDMVQDPETGLWRVYDGMVKPLHD